MKQSEFARFHGVSRKTVTGWKNKGWIVLNADGTVDVEESNKNIEQYRSGKYQEDSPVIQNEKTVTQSVTQDGWVTDLGNTLGNKGNTFEGNSSGNNTEGNTNSLSDDCETNEEVALPAKELNRRLTLEKLKVERERAKAAKFETDIREGKLLLAEDVARHDAEVGSRLKKKLLALPTELAVRVAAVSSPAEVESLLRAEITDALNEFLDAYGVHYS